MSQDSQLSLTETKNSQTSAASGSRDSIVYSVEQLNINIRQVLEGQLGIVWLKAEISNFKPHTSGHWYFSLKDPRAQISAIMFRGANSRIKFKAHDGLEVIVRGKITVYEPRGTYQIVCDSMEPVGAGALQKQFEQLKEKLKLEGLFETARKKQLPSLPKTIAIVTSPTGAAIQDILNIMSRRAPHVEITVVPALVQGAAAAPSLIEAFAKAQLLKPDVIIIGRGGGSVEDMWCFNDESLARAISASTIPVISAVGHEIDFTICDFVSDLRAPTPSAAAELVAKSAQELNHKVEQLTRLLKNSFEKIFRLKAQTLMSLTRQLVDPKKKLQDYTLRNDELLSRLEQAMRVYLSHKRKDVELIQTRMASPAQLIQKIMTQLNHIQTRMSSEVQKMLETSELRLKNMMSLLDSLSPLRVVDRGFSITTKKSSVIKSIKDVKTDDVIDIQVTDGHITATVTGTQKEKRS